MKILHIIPFLWSGAGAVVTRLCEDQAKKHTVHVVTSRRIGDLADWASYRRRLRKAGVRLDTANFFKRDPETFWPETQRLAALATALRPDIVHTHAGVPTAAALVVRDTTGLAFPILAQMYNWTPGRPAWMNTADLWAFRRADAVACSARSYLALLRDAGVRRGRLIYLPWGLPVTADVSDDDARRPPAKQPRIGFVGRLEPRKDQLFLIEVLAALRAGDRDWSLELVGPDGDEAYGRAVRRRAAQPDVRGRVLCIGAVSVPLRHVRRWSVFVSASHDEGQGLAIQEAMAVGVPVVARAAAGVEDYLTHEKTGFLVRGGGVRLFAAEIARAAGDTARVRRVTATARRLIVRRYGWAGTLRRFDRLYAALTRRG